MIIKNLNIENIRSYTQAEIEFPEGSTLLSGDIGSGKSTILLAIEFALFGTKGKELSSSSLLRHGSSKGHVEMTFQIDDKDITIRRVLKRTSNSIKQENGYIIREGVKTDYTPVELRNQVLSILGYPKNLATKTKDLVYRFTVYTAQEQMKHILYDDNERLSILRRVFQIDKYEVIKKNLNIYAKYLREKKRNKEEKISNLGEKKNELKESNEKAQQIQSNLEKSQYELKKLKTQVEESQKSRDNLQKEIEKLKEKKSRFNTILDNEKSLQETLQNLNSQKQKLSEDMQTIKEKFEKIKIEKPTDKTNEEIEKEISELEKKIHNIENTKATLNEQIRNVNYNIKKTDETLNNFETNQKKLKEKEEQKIKLQKTEPTDTKQLTDKENELSELIKRQAEIETQRNSALKVIEQVSNLNHCPTCKQDVSSEHKDKIIFEENNKIENSKYEQITNDIKITKENIEYLKNKINEDQKRENQLKILDSEIKNLQEILSTSEKEKQNRQKLQEQLDEKQKQLKELEDTEKLKTELNKLKALQKSLYEFLTKFNEKKHLKEMYTDKKQLFEKAQKEITEKGEKLQEFIKEKQSLEEELKGLEKLEKNFQEISENHEKLTKQEKEKEIEKAASEKELHYLNKDISRLTYEISEMQKIKEDIQRIETYKTWLTDYLSKIVDTIEKNVMMKVYHEFNEQFMSWFSLIIEDETISARLDEEFTPLIEQNGYETTIENLSGGEKTAVALAYRLALNKVINDLINEIKTKDMLVLDEPTDGFSSEQLDRVRDVLEQLNLKQVLLVSHEPKLETFVENIIRIEKSQHVSSLQKLY